ncbi:DUF5667 domain-containing protein [Nonomuraea sp. NPDC050310]|uniref:DUF5667 domain-containing protein n=1 Tax=Nonomuraea sp. NPDC050310 TaxID=3154935 RepID=UPI00340A8802
MRKSRREAEERLMAQLAELQHAPLGGGPDATFRAKLREQLMTAGPAPAEPLARPVRPVRRLSWFTQLATVGLTASMMVWAALTYHSLPGDALYPLKRAAEDTLVRLSADPVDRAERELVSAKTRAEELNALLDSPDGGQHVAATLDDMATSTRSGISKLPRSTTVKEFAEDQRDMVEPMLERVAGADQDKVNGYLQYIDGLVAPQ